MKTFTKSITLLIAILLFSSIISAKGFEMEVEKYIDDIPFNTEVIAAKAIYDQALTVEFDMEEEDYINDIPFNTDSLAKVSLSKQALAQEFNIEEEEYIDDIPFNTSLIAFEYNVNCSSLIAKK